MLSLLLIMIVLEALANEIRSGYLKELLSLPAFTCLKSTIATLELRCEICSS